MTDIDQAGVPVDEATAKDFMMVRAALVKRLGGANEALVWTRIDYRANSAREAHRTDDGTHWWAATYPEIASETGLTAEQARRAVEKLIDGGFLRAEQHHGFARTRSYTPIFAHVADSPDGQDASSIRRDGQIDLADSPDVPLIETSRQGDTPVVPKGDPVDEAFALVWEKWPTPRRGTTKKSGSAFRTALTAVGGVRQVQIILDAIDRDVAVWRTWPRSDVQYIPLLSTWLNQERWQPSAAALPRTQRETYAQQKQDNNLALLARYRDGESNGEITGSGAGGLRAINAGT
jgi:hypothetical protein